MTRGLDFDQVDRDAELATAGSRFEYADFGWDIPTVPDPRFRVAMFAMAGMTIFMPADGLLAPAATKWWLVGGTRIILLGDVHEALADLVGNYTNEELMERVGLQRKALHHLRLFLALPAGPTGQLGGARPKAGRKRK